MKKRLVSLVGLFLLAAVALPGDDRKDEVFRQVERAVRHGHRCPVLEDAEGNAPAGAPDLTRVFIANDSENIYFLLEFADPVASTADFPFVSVKLNTDFDQTTGCNVGVPALGGHEYEIFFDHPGFHPAYIGDAQDCSSSPADFPGALKASTRGRFAAAIVTRSIFQGFLRGFLVRVDALHNSHDLAVYYVE